MNDTNASLMDVSVMYLLQPNSFFYVFVSFILVHWTSKKGYCSGFGQNRNRIVTDYSGVKAALWQRILDEGDNRKVENLGRSLTALEIN